MIIREPKIDPLRRGPARLEEFTIGDLEAVRLVLRGSSVIDWYRLNFRSREEVQAFLRVNEFDPSSGRDRERLRDLIRRAVWYLRENLSIQVPDEVAKAPSIEELLLWASGVDATRTKAIGACTVLKVIHILHHLEARELLFNTAISEAELRVLMNEKVEGVVGSLIAQGYPIVEFTGSSKSRVSMMTKLASKRQTIAAQIFDKVRYRIVVPERRDLPVILLALTQNLFPFSYTVPGQTQNSLVDLRQVLEETPALHPLADQLQTDFTAEEDGHPGNEFSGSSYKVVNFVVDIPLRIDHYLGHLDDPAVRGLGSIVFMMAEIQLLDVATARNNESGENSHRCYKERQRVRVRERLLRGARNALFPAR